MRRVVDILVILLVVAVGAVVVSQRKADEQSVTTLADVQQSLDRLYERTSYYGALEKTQEQTSKTLWPVEIDPAWFGDELPQNGLLPGVNDASADRPWLDIAPPGDQGVHPPDPIAVRPDQAQFWYNPNLGVFRARVSPKLGYGDALKMYNQLNGLELAELHHDTEPTRTPLAYTPGHAPGATHASPNQPAPTAADRVATKPEPSLFRPEPAPAFYPVAEVEADHEPAKPQGRRRLKDN